MGHEQVLPFRVSGPGNNSIEGILCILPLDGLVLYPEHSLVVVVEGVFPLCRRYSRRILLKQMTRLNSFDLVNNFFFKFLSFIPKIDFISLKYEFIYLFKLNDVVLVVKSLGSVVLNNYED